MAERSGAQLPTISKKSSKFHIVVVRKNRIFRGFKAKQYAIVSECVLLWVFNLLNDWV